MQRIFDGHNDMLLRLWQAGDLEGRRFLDGDQAGHIDLPRARAGGLAAGFFAIYVPGEAGLFSAGRRAPGGIMDIPYIPAIDTPRARQVTLEMMALLLRLDRAAPQAIRLCRTVADIDAANRVGALAAIAHIEGAEAVGGSLAELTVLHAAGLRSLGPVWSRPNRFGFGVPFRFPADPDIGPGLTAEGKALVAECDRLGIMLDLSHLNRAGFDDAASISANPLIATHSNAHALCPASRNLTDDQLRIVAQTDGVVGLNYAVGFLREDGRDEADTPLEVLIRHLDHLLAILGEDGVALGSDFDGALIPQDLGDCAGLQKLVAAMEAADYGAPLIEKICWSNWRTALARVIG